MAVTRLYAAQSFLRRQWHAELVKESPAFVEPEGLLPCLQKPIADPCPQQSKSSPTNFSPILRCVLILSLHLRVHLSRGYFPSGFSTKTSHGIFYNDLNVFFAQDQKMNAQ